MFLDFFLRSFQHHSPGFLWKCIGIFFLSIGVVIGMFFLFQLLIPYLGAAESGLLVATLLIVLGSGLVLTGQKKEVASQGDILDAFKEEINIEKVENFLKNNAFSISLVSFIAGVVLSQLKGGKNPVDIFKILKYLGK